MSAVDHHSEVARLLHKQSEWHDDRRTGIGGSEAAKIMDGEWNGLWLEKTGRVEPEDLSDNLPVAMGTWTEELNRYWFGRKTGKTVLHRKEPFVCPKRKFMRANLDGWIDPPEKAVYEAKHTNAWETEQNAVSRFYAQCQHNMEVFGADLCWLSVFFGSDRYEYYDIGRSQDFIDEMVEKEAQFWGYVERDEPPPGMTPAEKVEIRFDDMREEDLSTSNTWCDLAGDWLENKLAAKAFTSAADELKSMVAQDVKVARGGGIVITRSKSGSLTIKKDTH